MVATYAKHYSTKSTPQTQPIPGKSQVENSAGGFVFEISDWERLERFLILGSEGGTYYASEQKLTRLNAQVVERLIAVDGERVVNTIVNVSSQGRAPKNEACLFALAMCMKLGGPVAKHHASVHFSSIVRTGTHLFHLAEYVKAFGGWGRGTRRAFAQWYTSKKPSTLAYQLVKYQQRDGWSHRDLIRLSHAKFDTPLDRKIIKWAGAPYNKSLGVLENELSDVPILEGFEKAKCCTSVKEVLPLIEKYNLTREMIPTQFLAEGAVWEAMLPKMPLHALVRNLANMTRLGVIQTLSPNLAVIEEKLSEENIKKSRLHPIAVLTALLTYKSGRSTKGSHTWTPVGRIVDMLDDAFYKSFGNVTPTGKATLLALDISGSMGGGTVAGVEGLTPRIAAAALCMVTARVEKNYGVVGFAHHLVGLDISAKMRLDQVVSELSKHDFGSTDCSLPVLYAQRNKIGVEAFAVYTDNETYQGSIHVCQALAEYRKKSGINAKMCVVGMTSTGFSIADPADLGMMDVVGFDTAAPEIMSNFFRGSVVEKVELEED